MKAEYERQIDEYTREKVMDTIKIETLVKKFQDNETNKNQVLDTFKKEMADYAELKREISRLQSKIVNLEDDLDAAKSQQANANQRQGNNMGLPNMLLPQIKGPSEREAINQQLELERERMRNEFSKGLDYNAGMDGLDALNAGKEQQRNGCTRCLSAMSNFWYRYGPLNSSVAHVKKNYDSSVTSFFVLFRFLYLLSLIIAMAYGYLLINHLVQTKDFSTTCLYNFVPCFLLYNSFGSGEAFGFTITLLGFLCVGFIFCLYQLVIQDRQTRIEAYLLQDGSKKFSKMFFNSPEWGLT